MHEHYGGNFPKLRDIGTNYMETCKSYTRTLFREPAQGKSVTEGAYNKEKVLRMVEKGGEEWRGPRTI